MSKKPFKNKMPKKPIRFTTIMIVIGALISVSLAALDAYKESAPAESDISYTEFKSYIDSGDIDSVRYIESQQTFNVKLKDGKEYSVINPKYEEFRKDILEAGIRLEVSKTSASDAIIGTLVGTPMIVFMFIFIYYIVKTMGNQTNTLFKVLKPEDIITFDHVAGMSETKEEVKFAVSQLQNAKKLKEIGARPCKGIILEGPPGTGKTLLAKAIAGEAGVPFISTSGADFIEMFVGLGAARVRALWELASINAPCVVFIDEIDAVGRRRSGGGDGASTESNQTLNALLQRMDGLGNGSGVFVVAATNRVEDLDPALLRPGRFDKKLFVGPPKTKKDRDEVINVHLNNKKIMSDFDFDRASKLMFGLSGAEIEQTINEAVMISVADNRDGAIGTKDIDNAVMKLRASGVAVTHASDTDREISAAHEAGHAIVSMALGRKISKVSIMPYSSGVGGMTIEDTDDKENRRLKTRKELYDDIKVLLAGRQSEQMMLGDTSIGCSNDIEKASVIAFAIVNNFAMDDGTLINVTALASAGLHLVDTKEKIKQANQIMVECQKEVETILENHKDKVKSLTDTLLNEETVLDLDLDYLD